MKKWREEKQGVKYCCGSKMNKQNQCILGGCIRRRNSSEKERVWNELGQREYGFEGIFGPTANNASVSKYSSDYGESPSHTQIHTNKNIKPALISPLPPKVSNLMSLEISSPATSSLASHAFLLPSPRAANTLCHIQGFNIEPNSKAGSCYRAAF